METQTINGNQTAKSGFSVRNNNRKQGHLALLLANIAWGLMSPVSKNILLQGEISPLALSAVRIGGAALMFLILNFILPESIAPREKIAPPDRLRLLIASLLMISANQGLFILGIGYTNPIDCAVMSSTTPMITMILAAIALHFPITKWKMAGVVTGMAGVILLVGGNRSGAIASNPLLGDSLCLAAQICAAVYYVYLIGLTKRYAPFTLMKWMFFISALTYVPCCSLQLANVEWTDLSSSTWLSLAFIIIFSTCMSYLAIPFAQRLLKPTVVSVYNYLQPVFAAIAAVWLGVGEFGWMKICATVLILSGVILVNAGSTEKSSA